MILNRIFQSLECLLPTFGHEQPKSSVPLAATVPSGSLICCVLPSASPLSLSLAAPLEWAYLYQPRRFYRAGVIKVCVTKKRASSLYSKYKIVIFNAPFQTTLQPQGFLISEPLRISDSGSFLVHTVHPLFGINTFSSCISSPFPCSVFVLMSTFLEPFESRLLIPFFF